MFKRTFPRNFLFRRAATRGARTESPHDVIIGDHPGSATPGSSEPDKGGQIRMSIVETSEARQQIERWIEESQLLLGRTIPSVLEDNQRLRDKLTGAQEESDRAREEVAALRRELGTLQSDLETLRGQYEFLKSEQAAVTDALGRAVHHMSQMVQPINEMVAKLHVTQAPSLESALR